MGVHILHPDELSLVLPYRGNADKYYVTVPYQLSDRRTKTWNDFFKTSKENKITPILRLNSEFDTDGGFWKIPSKKEIVEEESRRLLELKHARDKIRRTVDDGGIEKILRNYPYDETEKKKILNNQLHEENEKGKKRRRKK